MRLYRRCQRCNGQVDVNEQSEPYGHQPCLRVLDASESANAEPQSQLDRTLAAGWHDRAVRMSKAAKMFEAAVDGDDAALAVDGKACSECVKALFAEYDVRLNDQVLFVAAYYKCLADAELQSKEEDPSKKRRSAAAQKDESEVEALEAELEALLREEAELEKQEAALASHLDRQVRQGVELRAEERVLAEERHTALAAIDSRRQRLEHHQKLRVHEDLFSIARDANEFPVINGFRLGSSPAVPIEWEEINAALGEAALLLHVCASKLRFKFSTFLPVPIGNVSRMEQMTGAKEAYMLAGSFRTAVMSSQFNTALGALLTATDQMAQALGRKFGVVPPYKVASDMIGDSRDNWYSVKRPMRDSAKWVKALSFLLSQLKFLLSIVVSADTRPSLSRGSSCNSSGSSVPTPTPPSKGAKK